MITDIPTETRASLSEIKKEIGDILGKIKPDKSI